MPARTPPPQIAVGWDQVLALRLARQHVVERRPATRFLEVVRDLVGVHAQVMSAAELQLAVRTEGLSATDVRDALWERRELVKVWAFRQTLHLLTPDDLVEFVSAAGSLERWHTPAWLRYFGLSEADVEAMLDAIAEALTAAPMTRAELIAAVADRVHKPELVDAMQTGWGTFLAPAAQRGHLVFGPSDGRNVTFVDPEEWLGRPISRRTEAAGSHGARDDEDPADGRDRPDDGRRADDPHRAGHAGDDALARLILRYLAVFPGATRDMIARWWGGGRLAAVNRALSVLGAELTEVDVEGARGIVRVGDVEALLAAGAVRGVRLLPGFDPFTNELPRRVDSVLTEARHALVHRTAGWVTPLVLLDGRISGTWELRSAGGHGAIEVTPWGRWRRGARKDVAAEVDRIAAFLDRSLRTEVGAAIG